MRYPNERSVVLLVVLALTAIVALGKTVTVDAPFNVNALIVRAAFA
jgi:hypothetical protein